MIDIPTSQEVLVPLLLTLKVAGWATLLATLSGIAIAFAVARLRFRGREIVDAMMTLPMVMPPTCTRPIEFRAFAPAPVTKTSGM